MRKNIFKYLCIALGISAVVIIILYLISLQSLQFNFANEGKLICTEKKDWGIFSKGDLNCFGIVPIVQQQIVTPTPIQVINGEPKLTK